MELLDRAEKIAKAVFQLAISVFNEIYTAVTRSMKSSIEDLNTMSLVQKEKFWAFDDDGTKNNVTYKNAWFLINRESRKHHDRNQRL